MNLKPTLKQLIIVLLQHKRDRRSPIQKALQDAFQRHYAGLFLWAMGKYQHKLNPESLEQELLRFGQDMLQNCREEKEEMGQSFDWWCQAFSRWRNKLD